MRRWNDWWRAGPATAKLDAGRDAAKSRGVCFGCPRKLNPEQAKLGQRLVEEGKAVREVAENLQCSRGDDLSGVSRRELKASEFSVPLLPDTRLPKPMARGSGDLALGWPQRRRPCLCPIKSVIRLKHDGMHSRLQRPDARNRPFGSSPTKDSRPTAGSLP